MQNYTSKAAYTPTIIDHHYASFKIYANHISWSLAKKKGGNKPRKKKITLYLHRTLSLKNVLAPSASTSL